MYTYGCDCAGLWAVGCDQSPCDHICVDTIDSYICYCYENWELQEDAHTCRRKLLLP